MFKKSETKPSKKKSTSRYLIIVNIFVVIEQWAASFTHPNPIFSSMPGNLVEEFLQTPTPTPLSKQPTTETSSTQKQTYPGNHQQAIQKFHHHWNARQYAEAADHAALAQSLALEAGHTQQAAKYANARQLAHKYQALKVELHKLQWNVAVHPILEPDDPPSSEATCNMVCTPDRPNLLQLSSSPHPQLPLQQPPTPLSLPTLHPQPQSESQIHETQNLHPTSELESTENQTLNHTNLDSQCANPCNLESNHIEKETHVTLCCLGIPWPWRRPR